MRADMHKGRQTKASGRVSFDRVSTEIQSMRHLKGFVNPGAQVGESNPDSPPWYERFGALRLLNDPLRLILPLKAIADALALAAKG
jgi:hypothetical protein